MRRRCTCGGILFEEAEDLDSIFLRCTRCVRKQRLQGENDDGEAQD